MRQNEIVTIAVLKRLFASPYKIEVCKTGYYNFHKVKLTQNSDRIIIYIQDYLLNIYDDLIR